MTGSLSVPAGRWTLRGSVDWSDSITQLSPLAEMFSTTWNASAGADWVAHASKTGRVTTDFTLNHREHNRYISGAELAEQNVTSLSLGINFARYLEQGQTSARLGAAFGLPILNANNDPDDIGDAVPRSQFAKLTGSLSTAYVLPGAASLNSDLSAQWTRHPLFSDDQMTIGSRATVRGFSNAAFQADSAVVWRNEVAFVLPVDKFLGPSEPVAGGGAAMPPSGARGVLESLNPYLFADAGVGRDIANDLIGYRVSAGAGLRYGGPCFSADAGYGFRLAADGETVPGHEPAGELFLTLRLKLS